MMRLNSLFRKVVAGASALGGVLAGGAAFAQAAIDPSAVVQTVTNNEGTITTIGGSILVLVVGIVAYRWVRRIIK